MLQEELRRIAARARTLDERLASRHPPALSGAGNSTDRAHSAWCRTAAKGDLARFARRLSWDGLSEVDVRGALQREVPPLDGPMPSWAHTLGACIRAVGSSSPARPRVGVEDIPFPEVLTPVADLADRMLAVRVSDASPSLSKEARAALRLQLLRRLAGVAAPTLHHRFNRLRRQRRRAPGAARPHGRSTALYDAFVREIVEDGAIDLFREYPVLGRLVATVVESWVEATSEFLCRLRADRNVIGRSFCRGEDPGRVTALMPGISDPHRGGRSVVAVTFSSGVEVVYKPRCLGMECAFNHLLTWVNQHGGPVSFRALEVVERGEYGWTEFAAYAPCATTDEVRDFYARAGGLLCLVYCLGGIDFHLENVIACGAHPVLVDLETALQPMLERQYRGQEEARARGFQTLFNGTVLGTGLLPVWQLGGGGGCFDPSGFAGSDEQGSFGEIRRWTDLGTDDMDLVREPGSVRPSRNVPRTSTGQSSLGDHQHAFLDGFARTYRFLLEQRDRLLAREGPLQSFRRRPVRFLFRPSAVYDRILQRSLQPGMLCEGVRRSIELELTARAFVASTGRPPLWPLQRAEMEALERMDVPLFTLSSTGCSLPVGDEDRISECFPKSAFHRATERIRRLSKKDLERQSQLVGASLSLRYPTHAPASSPKEGARRTWTEAWNPDAALCAAVEVGEQLERYGVPLKGGGVVWATFEPVGQGWRQRLRPTGLGVADGACGIALFLAALARVSGRDAFATAALDALAPFRRHILGEGGRFPRTPDDAGAEPTGAWDWTVHSLLVTAELLGEPELMYEVQALDRGLRDRRRREAIGWTPECPADGGSFTIDRALRDGCWDADDLFGGTFGAVEALLEAGLRMPRPDLVTAARERATWAVYRARQAGGFRVAPAGGANTFHPGFLRGNAGIGYVLLRSLAPEDIPPVMGWDRWHVHPVRS